MRMYDLNMAGLFEYSGNDGLMAVHSVAILPDPTTVFGLEVFLGHMGGRSGRAAGARVVDPGGRGGRGRKRLGGRGTRVRRGLADPHSTCPTSSSAPSATPAARRSPCSRRCGGVDPAEIVSRRFRTGVATAIGPHASLPELDMARWVGEGEARSFWWLGRCRRLTRCDRLRDLVLPGRRHVVRLGVSRDGVARQRNSSWVDLRGFEPRARSVLRQHIGAARTRAAGLSDGIPNPCTPCTPCRSATNCATDPYPRWQLD